MANAPLADKAVVKDSSTQAEEIPTAGPTHAQKDNVAAEKEYSLDDF